MVALDFNLVKTLTCHDKSQWWLSNLVYGNVGLARVYTITHTRVPPKQSASSVPTQVLLFTKLVHYGNPSSTAPRFEAYNSGESGSSLAHDECGPTEPRKRPRTCYVRRHSHEPCDLAYSPSCSKLRPGQGTEPIAF